MGAGRNAGQHKGGKGDMKEKTKPGYPQGPEGVSKTVESPNYPRSNTAGGGKKK